MKIQTILALLFAFNAYSIPLDKMEWNSRESVRSLCSQIKGVDKYSVGKEGEIFQKIYQREFLRSLAKVDTILGYNICKLNQNDFESLLASPYRLRTVVNSCFELLKKNQSIPSENKEKKFSSSQLRLFSSIQKMKNANDLYLLFFENYVAKDLIKSVLRSDKIKEEAWNNLFKVGGPFEPFFKYGYDKLIGVFSANIIREVILELNLGERVSTFSLLLASCNELESRGVTTFQENFLITYIRSYTISDFSILNKACDTLWKDAGAIAKTSSWLRTFFSKESSKSRFCLETIRKVGTQKEEIEKLQKTVQDIVAYVAGMVIDTNEFELPSLPVSVQSASDSNQGLPGNEDGLTSIGTQEFNRKLLVLLEKLSACPILMQGIMSAREDFINENLGRNGKSSIRCKESLLGSDSTSFRLGNISISGPLKELCNPLDNFKFTMRDSGFYYDQCSYKIGPSDSSQVTELFGFINRIVPEKVLINGFTDEVQIINGCNENIMNNYVLSEKRALEIARIGNVVLKKGIIRYHGNGEIRNIPECINEECRRLKRKVIIEVYGGLFNTDVIKCLSQCN